MKSEEGEEHGAEEEAAPPQGTAEAPMAGLAAVPVAGGVAVPAEGGTALPAVKGGPTPEVGVVVGLGWVDVRVVGRRCGQMEVVGQVLALANCAAQWPGYPRE